jgi:cytoskeletal protein CcmA (bactofilin family)
MGLQDFRKGGVAPVAGGGVGALTAFIDQGSEFSGKLSFKDTVRIDGRFEGEISSDNTLIVGETGEIHANIRSQVVIVSGTVVGDISAGRQITLHKTAKVKGNLQTASLIVEEGALFNGQIAMGAEAGKKPGDNVVKMQEKKV